MNVVLQPYHNLFIYTSLITPKISLVPSGVNTLPPAQDAGNQ